MAKFKTNLTIDESNGFEGSLDLKVKKQGELAVWTDDTTGAQIRATGKNFEVSGDNEDYLGGGKITGVVVTDGDDKTILTISDLNIKATKLMAAFDDGGSTGALYFLTKGDDTVVGSKTANAILGGAGDDTMTGGKGADYFQFHAEMVWEQPLRKGAAEHDVITDFDTTGDDRDGLQYLGEFDYAKANKGHDTLITYEDGSTLLLEGVKKSEFHTYLENMPEL